MDSPIPAGVLLMDDKNSKPPGKARRRAGRLKKGEGDIRARQRSFIKQRSAVLLPHEEDELAQPEDRDASPHDREHQERIAEYRQRERKRAGAPGDPADAEQAGEDD